MHNQFITVQEAIDLIKSDTRENPVVDIDFIINNYNYIELFHNFNIPLLTRNSKGEVVENGNRYITFERELDVLTFKDVALSHFKEMTSAEYDEEAIKNPTRSITTVSDPKNNPGARPQANANGAKVGDDGNVRG
mgnify:CR=1 FL=1